MEELSSNSRLVKVRIREATHADLPLEVTVYVYDGHLCSALSPNTLVRAVM